MAILYVTEVGAQVRKVGERLVLTRGNEVLEEIPLVQVDQVVMVGRSVSLTTAAMFALTTKGVRITYLTGGGRHVADVKGPEHKNGRLRHTQSLVVEQPEKAQRLAAAVVRGKIINQRVLVRRHVEGAPWASSSLSGMDAMLKRVDGALTLDELRGLEGQAAKDYFALLRRLLARPRDGETWGFERRAYYPPPDPINALLSFGYTLLLNDMVAACEIAGLDPYLGCFHAIDYGRPSMALDLIEPFRPVIVDSIVMTIVNRGWIGLRDFQARSSEDDLDEENRMRARTQAKGEPPAIYLTSEGRKKFLSWYAERVNEQAYLPALPGSGTRPERTTYRRMFLLQAQQMARVILGESSTYTAYTMR